MDRIGAGVMAAAVVAGTAGAAAFVAQAAGATHVAMALVAGLAGAGAVAALLAWPRLMGPRQAR